MTRYLKNLRNKFTTEQLRIAQEVIDEIMREKESAPTGPKKREPRLGEVWGNGNDDFLILNNNPVYIESRESYNVMGMSLYPDSKYIFATQTNVYEFLAPSLAAYFAEQFRREPPEGLVSKRAAIMAIASMPKTDDFTKNAIDSGRFDRLLRIGLRADLNLLEISNALLNRAINLERKERENA